MRRDPAYLEDILEAADGIAGIVRDLNLETLMGEAVLQAAALHYLAVIGEAANRLSSELRERHADVPWPDIVSQRNRVVHDYFGLDWNLLRKTLVEDVPHLRSRVARILRDEMADDQEGYPA